MTKTRSKKRVPIALLFVAIIVSLGIGGVSGFFLGVASTEAGAEFLEAMFETEQQAEILSPTKIDRESFELRYPSNWKIDVKDDEYDPDTNFSIESPGSAFVMFRMGDLDTLTPEESLEIFSDTYSELMDKPIITKFKSYGKHQGEGAIFKGRVLGMQHTMRIFSAASNGKTIIIIEQYPNEDFKYVKDGLQLIEKSFVMNPALKEK